MIGFVKPGCYAKRNNLHSNGMAVIHGCYARRNTPHSFLGDLRRGRFGPTSASLKYIENWTYVHAHIQRTSTLKSEVDAICVHVKMEVKGPSKDKVLVEGPKLTIFSLTSNAPSANKKYIYAGISRAGGMSRKAMICLHIVEWRSRSYHVQ